VPGAVSTNHRTKNNAIRSDTMPATINGTFTGDGNWGTTGNWIGGALPAAAENAHISNSSRNINGSDETATTLGVVSVHNTMLGSIGKSDLQLDLKAATLDYDGRGPEAWIYGDFSSGVIVNGTGAGTLHLKDFGVGASLNDVTIQGAANVVIEAGATLGVARFYAGGALTIGTGVTATRAELYAGVTLVGSDIPIEVFSGATGKTTDSAQPATVVVHSGAVFEILSDSTLASVEVKPGGRLITANNPSKITITALTEHKGATIDIDTEQDTVDVGSWTRVGFSAAA